MQPEWLVRLAYDTAMQIKSDVEACNILCDRRGLTGSQISAPAQSALWVSGSSEHDCTCDSTSQSKKDFEHICFFMTKDWLQKSSKTQRNILFLPDKSSKTQVQRLHTFLCISWACLDISWACLERVARLVCSDYMHMHVYLELAFQKWAYWCAVITHICLHILSSTFKSRKTCLQGWHALRPT